MKKLILVLVLAATSSQAVAQGGWQIVLIHGAVDAPIVQH